MPSTAAMISLVCLARRKVLETSTSGRNSREAKRKLARLEPPSLGERDVVRIGETPSRIGLRLAVANQNDFALPLTFHLFFAYDIIQWLLLAGRKKSSTSLRRIRSRTATVPATKKSR